MKIQIDGKTIITLEEEDLYLFKSRVKDDIDYKEDIKRRVCWIINKSLSDFWQSFREEWTEIFMKDNTVESIPSTKKKFILMVKNTKENKDNNRCQQKIPSITK